MLIDIVLLGWDAEELLLLFVGTQLLIIAIRDLHLSDVKWDYVLEFNFCVFKLNINVCEKNDMSCRKVQDCV